MFRKVTQKVAYFKTEAYASRSSVAQSQYKIKKKSKDQSSVTERTALNKFRSKTMFSNFVKCCLCRSNCLESQAVVIEIDELLNVDVIDLETVDQMRRFNKLWRCNNCTPESITKFDRPMHVGCKLQLEKSGNYNKLTPVVNTNDDSETNYDQNFDHDKNIVVSFPRSSDCLQILSNIPHKTIENINWLVYKDTPYTVEDIELLYLNQLAKYKSRDVRSDFYQAQVVDEDARSISKVKKTCFDGKIHGSSKWSEDRASDVAHMMTQLGKSAFQLEFKISAHSPNVMATVLLQKNCAVTANLVGNEHQELMQEYFVHQGN